MTHNMHNGSWLYFHLFIILNSNTTLFTCLPDLWRLCGFHLWRHSCWSESERTSSLFVLCFVFESHLWQCRGACPLPVILFTFLRAVIKGALSQGQGEAHLPFDTSNKMQMGRVENFAGCAGMDEHDKQYTQRWQRARKVKTQTND